MSGRVDDIYVLHLEIIGGDEKRCLQRSVLGLGVDRENRELGGGSMVEWERLTAAIITSCNRRVFSMCNNYCVGYGILTWVGGAFESETSFADGELFFVGSGIDVNCIAS
jgi:hypothetical protein